MSAATWSISRKAGSSGAPGSTASGEDERKALAPLIETVEEGRSPADRLLADYHGPWRGDIDKRVRHPGILVPLSNGEV